jgi:hypothetical protein
VYTKSKTSELSPLRRKLLRFAKQFPPPLRSNKYIQAAKHEILQSTFWKKARLEKEHRGAA